MATLGLAWWAGSARRAAAALLLSAQVACAATATTEAPADAGQADAAADVATKLPKHKLFVLDTVMFTRQGPGGIAPGWNLDGVVSGAEDAASCNHADFTSPEGLPGVDNTFATLMPLIEKTGISAVEKLLQASIESGGILLVVELDDATSVAEGQAKVRIRAGQGLPLLGTDGKLLSGQTFHVSKRDPGMAAVLGTIQGGMLETAPFDLDLPVQIFGKDYTLALRSGRVRFRILDGERIEAGLLGGGITIASVRAIAKQASEDQPNIADIVESLIGGVGDLARDATGECQQVSAVLSFTGVSAYFYPGDVTGTVAP